MVSEQQILEAANEIRRGGLVAFPTETVYGLGANALNAKAVSGIFAMKERPSFDPLIVHISRLESIHQLVEEFDERMLRLAEAFWPGPLTMVVPKSNLVPDIVTAGLSRVGIRMPANDIALRLIEASAVPVAAPSANKFGKLSPTKASHVKKQLPDLKYILDGGNTSIGVESTVVSIENDGFRILRHGAVTADELRKYLPESSEKETQVLKITAPGMMLSHYSPEKPVYILGEHPIPKDTSKAAFLTAGGKVPANYACFEVLSSNFDASEVAVNLFGALHRMEESDCEFIVAEPISETGIGIAVMDRLRKAAYRHHNL